METQKRNHLCGTTEGSYIWCNSTDNTGIIFAGIVWAAILFAAGVCIAILIEREITVYNAAIILVLIFLSLWAHLKTMLGDPGAVPINAYPLQLGDERSNMNISMCGRCDGYKPPRSHHDRISNRCISRMDHFCPWMNNAIGAKNQKNFMLFLIYTDIVSAYMYIIVAWHMIDCTAGSDCETNPYKGVSLQLVRVLIFVLLFAVLFTSSMILNQIYGLTIGQGTIDRMKGNRDALDSATPVPFSHVFGSSYLTYFLPLDPVFTSEEEVFFYRLGEEKYQSIL